MDIRSLEPKINDAARLMDMLSQPARLKILCILVDGEASVQALADSVRATQPAVSHHLKKLRDASLVKTRRDAQTIYYSLHGVEVTAIIKVLHHLYCEK